MKRRDFLKGAVAAVAMVALPVTLIPKTQTFALTRTWKLVATDRDVRNCTDIFVFQRKHGRERQLAEIAVPWWEEATLKVAQAFVEEVYP